MTIDEVEAGEQKIGQEYVITKLARVMLSGTRELKVGDVVKLHAFIDGGDDGMFPEYDIPNAPHALCLASKVEVDET